MPLPRPVGRQVDAVYLPATGHHVVLGTAGTGKTVMAVHRAAHLADAATGNAGPVLLLTFNKSLMLYLRYIAAEYSGAMRIENYHTFARGYLKSLGRMSYNGIPSSHERARYIREAVETVRAGYSKESAWFFDRSYEFFDDELNWIDGNGLRERSQYLSAARIGRMAPLRADAREAMWAIRQRYHERRKECGREYDWSSLPVAVRDAFKEDARERMYRHIVVDEAQDLSPEAIRSLVEALQDGGSITLFADYAQQIYGQRISWRSCGLLVRRHEIFTDNYRNTAAIADLAIAMSDMPHFRDSADLISPVAPVAAGAKPTLVKCASAAEEIALCRSRAAAAGKYSRIGVLARSWEEGRRATAGVANVRDLRNFSRWDTSPAVYIGTYHSAKGLEFDSVILPFCSATRLPDPAVSEAFGVDEAMSREARLLYVGVTRARTDLLVTFTGSLTNLLPPAESNLWTIAAP